LRRIGVLKPTGWLLRAAKQVVDDFFTILAWWAFSENEKAEI